VKTLPATPPVVTPSNDAGASIEETLRSVLAKAVEAMKRNSNVAFVGPNNLCVDMHGVGLSRTQGRQTDLAADEAPATWSFTGERKLR